MTTVERLLQSVFAGKKFESGHRQIEDKDNAGSDKVTLLTFQVTANSIISRI